MPDLTREQAAAIHFYTQESQLYKQLNATLRGKGEARKAKLRPFMAYHKLFMTALHQVRRSCTWPCWRSRLRTALLSPVQALAASAEGRRCAITRTPPRDRCPRCAARCGAASWAT